jgi:hypothetical protein
MGQEQGTGQQRTSCSRLWQVAQGHPSLRDGDALRKDESDCDERDQKSPGL